MGVVFIFSDSVILGGTTPYLRSVQVRISSMSYETLRGVYTEPVEVLRVTSLGGSSPGARHDRN